MKADANVKRFSVAVGLVAAIVMGQNLSAQMVSKEALVKALQTGGYVIVMRHASSPQQPPDKSTANADNRSYERQLDEAGKAASLAMGKALKQLQIPIGRVYCSPTYRTRETAHLAQLPAPAIVPELGDGGQSMQGATEAQAAWLRKKVTEFPKDTNTFIVTHMPNMTQAFPQSTQGLSDGEALVFGPDGKGGAKLVARVKMDEWPKLRP